MRQINHRVIEEFRTNDGALSGPMAGAPVLLLTTIGRQSGCEHTTPVGFVDDGGRLVIAAANGGADHHPDWYGNLLADPAVTVEVPGATIGARALAADGEDRLRLLAALTAALPGLAEHVADTDREVPVVILTEER